MRVKLCNIEEFDICNELPKSIYKYRELANEEHKRIITHQEIYFPPPSKLPGNHECTYTIDREYLRNERNRREFYATHYQVNDLYHPLVNEAIRIYETTDEKIEEQELERKEYHNKHFGVFSGSRTPRNTHLWEIFGDNSKGFCCELDFSLFPLTIGTMGDVKYVKKEDLPKSKTINFDNQPEFFKYYSDVILKLPEDYQKEQEYRIQRFITHESQRLLKVPKKYITTIYLGRKMSNTAIVEIIDLIKTNLPHTKIKKFKYQSGGGLKEHEID